MALLCEYLQEVLVKFFHCSESYMVLGHLQFTCKRVSDTNTGL